MSVLIPYCVCDLKKKKILIVNYIKKKVEVYPWKLNVSYHFHQNYLLVLRL